MSEEKKSKILPPRKPTECRPTLSDHTLHHKGRTPNVYDALPRDFEFAYMTPSYYATGFGIIDVYKTEFDFTQFRKLTFIEDRELQHKWGLLRSRIPYAKGRITDLPGTREFNYRNYCLRNIMPGTAMSWRKSIFKFDYTEKEVEVEAEVEVEVEEKKECTCNLSEEGECVCQNMNGNGS